MPDILSLLSELSQSNYRSLFLNSKLSNLHHKFRLAAVAGPYPFLVRRYGFSGPVTSRRKELIRDFFHVKKKKKKK